jgi:hypothetical protein
MGIEPTRRRTSWRRVAAVLALLCLAGLSAAGVLDRGLDAAVRPLAPAQVRASLHRVQIRAAAAYVTARALGRVVAVASSATVNAGVAVGGSLDIGRVLDPIDKLLETFSDVMMASLVAVTTQLVLSDICDAYALPWLLPIGLALLALALAARRPAQGPLRRAAGALILAAMLAKLALPVAVTTTEALSTQFLAQRAAAAAQVVQATQTEVAAAEAAAGGDARAWYDPRRLTDRLGSLAPGDFAARIDGAVDAILTWMTLFLLETIAMPLGIGLAVVAFGRAIARRTRW